MYQGILIFNIPKSCLTYPEKICIYYFIVYCYFTELLKIGSTKPSTIKSIKIRCRCIFSTSCCSKEKKIKMRILFFL